MPPLSILTARGLRAQASGLCGGRAVEIAHVQRLAAHVVGFDAEQGCRAAFAVHVVENESRGFISVHQQFGYSHRVAASEIIPLLLDGGLAFVRRAAEISNHKTFRPKAAKNFIQIP